MRGNLSRQAEAEGRSEYAWRVGCCSAETMDVKSFWRTDIVVYFAERSGLLDFERQVVTIWKLHDNLEVVRSRVAGWG